jgi:hypothetical protein
MTRFALFLAVAGTAAAQSMTESAALAGGVAAGGVAGKKVSDGIDAVFRKTGAAVKDAAKSPSGKTGPVETIRIGPGTPRLDSVPPPPPIRGARPAPPPRPELPRVAAYLPEPVVVPAPPPKPPPPPMTPEDLGRVAQGMPREELLKLGTPAARITMFDDGHLVEVFRYMAGDLSVGAVRLSDGAVTSVVVRR